MKTFAAFLLVVVVCVFAAPAAQPQQDLLTNPMASIQQLMALPLQVFLSLFQNGMGLMQGMGGRAATLTNSAMGSVIPGAN